MKRSKVCWLAVVVSCLDLTGHVGASAAEPVPLVITSVQPLALIVNAVCQKECRSRSMIPKGVSEHHWEPTPKDVLQFQAAAVYIGVGLGFDESMFKTITAKNKSQVPITFVGDAVRPRLWTAVVSKSGQPPNAHPHRHNKSHEKADAHFGEHRHGQWDPHFWFDASRMAEAVPVITKALVAALPASASKLMPQSEAVIQELRALDAEIKAMKAQWPKNTVIVFHDALGYWSEQYEQDIRPLVGGGSGHEISAKTFGALVREFKSKKVASIVVERTEGAASNLARDLKTKVVVLDFGGKSDANTYPDWLRGFARSWDQVVR